VWLVGTTLVERSDTAGGVQWPALSPGRYEVKARRLGFDLLDKVLTLKPGQHLDSVWQMRERPVVLSEMVVNGHVVFMSPFLREPLRRAALGFGEFIYADDIFRRNPMRTADALDGLPGIGIVDAFPGSVDNRGDPVSRYVRFRRCKPPQSRVDVFIDGARVTYLSSADAALDLVDPRNIELIEVYQDSGRIPAEFMTGACAVIVIWTKRG
jgi:hypothetical protein